MSKSKKAKKTISMKWNDLIKNTKQSKPVCNTAVGALWGTDKEFKKNREK